MHHYWYANEALASGFALPELGVRQQHASDVIALTDSASSLFPRQNTDWRHDWPDAHGNSTLSGARVGKRFHLLVPRAAQASFIADEGEISASPLPEATPETFRHALLDQILPRMLAQRGRLVLHGSMITTPEGRTCVMLGESGMGKSTLAGAFSCLGAQVHTDDCFIVDAGLDECTVTATYPGLRLWPDSLRQLFPDRAGDASPMAHYCDKARLPATAMARPDPVRLDAILLLRRPASATATAIETARVSARDALIAMMTNSFQMDVSDTAHVGKLFDQAARAAVQVPAHAISYPRDYAALPRVTDRIRTLLTGASTAPDITAASKS